MTTFHFSPLVLQQIKDDFLTDAEFDSVEKLVDNFFIWDKGTEFSVIKQWFIENKMSIEFSRII